VREIREEFGITVAVDSFFTENRHTYDHGDIRLLAFRLAWLEGVMEMRDHDRIAWLRPAEILELELLPADVPIAQALIGADRPANPSGAG
jgi:8-oxo-dGTP diphosphatase